MHGLEADVAFLTFRVLGDADCDGEGLLVFFVGVVLFCVAGAVYFLAHLLAGLAGASGPSGKFCYNILFDNLHRGASGQ